jgi:hypothetical protein
MNFEPISIINSSMSIPASTARLLIITYFGRMPKSKRVQKKVLKRAIFKSLVEGLIKEGVPVSERMKRRYLR